MVKEVITVHSENHTRPVNENAHLLILNQVVHIVPAGLHLKIMHNP